MSADSTAPSTPAAGAGRNARYGLIFFAFYCVLYGGFMGLIAFKFKAMGESVAGVNWAIVYGMGLIVAALLLAVLYMFVCSPAGEHADTIKSEGQSAEDKK